MVLNVGAVGMGNIGNRHAEIYMENPKTELVAVCDIVKEKADNAAEKYNAEVFYDLKWDMMVLNLLAILEKKLKKF